MFSPCSRSRMPLPTSSAYTNRLTTELSLSSLIVWAGSHSRSYALIRSLSAIFARAWSSLKSNLAISSALYRDYYKFQYGLANGLLSLAILIVPRRARAFFPTRPRVLILLGIPGGLLLPSLRHLAGLDRLVLLLRVALLGHRHNRGVNDLAAARNIAFSLKMLAEALKQLVDQLGLRQRFAKQPDRGGIRH